MVRERFLITLYEYVQLFKDSWEILSETVNFMQKDARVSESKKINSYMQPGLVHNRFHFKFTEWFLLLGKDFFTSASPLTPPMI